MSKQIRDLTEGNIAKNLFKYTLPAILAILLSRIYTTVDSIMVGKIIGESGLAATGSTASFITTLSALLWGAGTGIAIYAGSLVSANKKEQSVRVIKTNLFLLIIISLTISVFGIFLYSPIFKLLAVDGAIYDQSLIYYIIILSSQFAVTINSFTNDLFFVMGNSSHAMKTSILNCMINVSLNYLFMAVLDWGVFGAGLATFISLVAIFLYNIYSLSKVCKGFSIAKQPIKINKENVAFAWKMAVPCMLQQGVMYISSAVVQPILNGMGIHATASFTVCLRIYDICTIFFYSASRGLSTLCSQCCGNGKAHLIKRGFITSMGLAVVFSAPIVILMLIFPNVVASIFLQNASGQTARYIVRYIRLCFPFVVLVILNNQFHNFFRGVLVPLLATISTICYSVGRIVFSFALSPIMGMDGIFLAFILSWATESIICFIMLISKKWRKRLDMKNSDL